MKVYSVLGQTDYEGNDLLGVFGSNNDALAYVAMYREQGRDIFDNICIVCSELGEEIIDQSGLEWV